MAVVQVQEAQVVQMPKQLGKTQQRVIAVLDHLRRNSSESFSYADLMSETGTPYDQLLYMLHAWEAVGVVSKHEVADGPGRPKVMFQWEDARALGARRASAR